MSSGVSFVLGFIGPCPETNMNPPAFVASEYGAIGGGAFSVRIISFTTRNSSIPNVNVHAV
jgi:hypothetical protein